LPKDVQAIIVSIDQYAGAALRKKELIETKERVDAELAEILGGASVKKERKSQTCSKCRSEEHSARTCPQKPPL
jgi:hypothetical protein